jgi:hypothetical protein
VKKTNSYFDQFGLIKVDEQILKAQSKRAKELYISSFSNKFAESEAKKLHKNAKWEYFQKKPPLFGEPTLNTWEYKFREKKENKVFLPINFKGGFFDKSLKDYTH